MGFWLMTTFISHFIILVTTLHKSWYNTLRLLIFILLDSHLKRLPQFSWQLTHCFTPSCLVHLSMNHTENTVSHQLYYGYSSVFTSPLHRNGHSSIVGCMYISEKPCLLMLPSNELFWLLGLMSQYSLLPVKRTCQLRLRNTVAFSSAVWLSKIQ
jgi:hypothetical protein